MKPIFLLVILILAGITTAFGQDEALFNIEMTVKLDAPGGNFKSNCNNYFDIYVYDVNNVLIINWNQKITSQSITYTYPKSTGLHKTKVGAISIAAKRQYGIYFGAGCETAGGSSDTPIKQNVIIDGPTKELHCKIPGWGEYPNNYLKVFIYPDIIDVKTNRPLYDTLPQALSTYSFPTEDSIRLSATNGFHTSVYKWQYSFNGTNWVDLPQYNGKQYIDICGKDIFGSVNNALDSVKAHKNIRFRIKHPHNDALSNFVVLDMVPSAPHIVSATLKDALCHGSSDGEIIIQFDRDLLIGEEIIIMLNGKNATTYLNHFDNKSVTIDSLESKTYEISLLGYYKIPQTGYGHTTFTDGANHKRNNIKINQPPSISFSASIIQHINCFGGNDGSVLINASGGTPPYNLYWKAPKQTAFIDTAITGNTTMADLVAGFYEYYIVDSRGCYVRKQNGELLTDTFSLNQPKTGMTVKLSDIQPSGYGFSNGSIGVEISGGTTPYTVSCKNNNGVTFSSVQEPPSGSNVVYRVSNIPAGKYTVTVSDAYNCPISRQYTLLQPEPLTVSISITKSILCNGNSNGELEANAIGGVGNYSYKWYKDGSSSSCGSGATLATIGKGNYEVKVTDSSSPANNASDSRYLGEPAPVALGSVQVQDVTCYNSNNGSATITAQGGSGQYKIMYKRAGGTESSVSGSSPVKISNLIEGDYTFKLEDSNGCQLQGSNTFTVKQPASALAIEFVDQKNTTGYGVSNGNASFRIKGGTPLSTSPLSYTITWKKQNQNLTTYTIVNKEENGWFVTKIDGISAGTYTVEAKDKNNCIITGQVVITEPAQLTANIAVDAPIDCHGNATGRLKAVIKGGVPHTGAGVMPYEIKWYKIVNGQDSLYNNITDSILSNLETGQYKVSVVDGSDPANTITSSIFPLAEPTLFVVGQQITVTDATCYNFNNGSIRLSVSGGAGSYRLFYKRKGTTDTWQEHPVHTDGHSFNMDNILAATYTIYITDANGCLARTDATLPAGGDFEVTVQQPDLLEAKLVQLKSTSGFGRTDGAIAYRIEGGTPNSLLPLSYNAAWFDDLGNPITQSDTIIDGYFVTRVKDLPQGTYTLEVKDKNYINKTNSCYLVKNPVVAEPAPLTVVLDNTATVDCYGATTGELIARVRGGVPYIGPNLIPYTFKWYEVINGQDSLFTNQKDSVLSNLRTGHYRVDIEDGSDPPNTVSSTVFHITQPTQLVTALTTRNISCCDKNDGFIHLTVTGGAGAYKLFYKRDTVNEPYREHPILADGHTFNIDNLYSAVYYVYIVDGNGCYAAINGDDVCKINLTQPQAPLGAANTVLRNVSGYGKHNGSVEVAITGGTMLSGNSYTVSWQDANGVKLTHTDNYTNGSYVSSINNLDKGTYTVTATDANYAIAYPGTQDACFYTNTFTIEEPDELTGAIEETHIVTCHGMSDGQLVARVRGGFAASGALPYKYVWYKSTGGSYQILAGQMDSILYNATAGDYRVEITDDSWLPNSITMSYTLVQPDPLAAVATNTTITCGQKVDVAVTVSGGTPPYRYEWSTGDNTPVLPDMVGGKYVVFVTDSRGCQTTATASVTAPSDMKIEGVVADPLCYKGSNGNIQIKVTGGNQPYTYRWSNGATTKDLSGAKAGIYSVIVTDKGDCSIMQSFTLKDPEPISVDIGEDRTLCAGQSHEIAPIVADPKTTFDWTGPNGFHSTAPQVIVGKEGTYRLTITDSNGCQATDEMQITVKNIDISSEIVVASQVHAGDTVIIVNISDPMPESLEWIMKSDSINVVASSEHQAAVIFKYPGQYAVGLRTFVNDCYADNIKTVTVLNAGEKPIDFFGEASIKNFAVSPVPNDGDFKVNVELSKEASIRLRIVNIGSGVVVSDRDYRSQQLYTIPYRMDIPAGTYAVILETVAGQRVIKMITK